MRVVADNHTLPYVPLSKERKGELAHIMRRGNKALKYLYDQVVEATGIKRKTYSRADFRDELVAAMKSGDTRSLRGVKMDPKALARIQAVTDLRMEILCGYTRSIEKLSYRYALAHPETIMSFQDYYDEGIIGALNAMYYYTDTNIAFMTYLYHCIRRRMANAVNKANPLSPWSNEARKLHMLYEEARAEFNRPTTFEEVANYLGFDLDERSIVQATLTEVYHATALPSQTEGSGATDSAIFDKLVIGKPLWVGHVLDECQRQAIEDAPLTPFERAVLKVFELEPFEGNNFMTGKWGWQTRVARENINPNTGRPYTKTFVKMALRSAIAKVQATYKQKRSQRASA